MRRVVVVAFGIMAVAWVLSAFVREPWQLTIVWGILVGLGSGAVGLVLGAIIVNRWFEERRGLLMGIFSASNASGQLVFLPALGVIVSGPGWRACAFTIAAVAALLIPLTLLLLRERPSDLGLPPLGAKAVVVSAPSTVNPFIRTIGALREGSRSRDFWLLAGSFFICGASTNGLIGTHLVPACGDHGIPEVRAAGLLAVMGLFDIVGTTASGWLTDRVNSRYLLFAYYGLRGLSLLFLPQAFGLAQLGLPAFAIFYGLDWVATVPPTLKLANEAFGRERGPLMFAWIASAHQIGAGAIAYGAGAIRTYTASYDMAFLISGGLCIAAALMVLAIGMQSRRPALVPN